MIRSTRLIHDELYERCLTWRETRRAIRQMVAYWDVNRIVWRLTLHSRLMRWLRRWI